MKYVNTALTYRWHCAIFQCLQVVLQGVLESLILKDRQEYLLEHGLEAQLLPILDDNISPRNVAIVAYK